MDQDRAAKHWWVGPVFAFAFVLGLAGAAAAGFWVHDPTDERYTAAPQCPPGFGVGQLTGVQRFPDGSWQPNYSCDREDTVALVEATWTPSPTATNGTVSPSPSPAPTK